MIKLNNMILIASLIIGILFLNAYHAKAQEEVFVLEGVLKCVDWSYGKCAEFKYYKKHIIYSEPTNPDTNKDTSTKGNSTDKFSGVSKKLSK